MQQHHSTVQKTEYLPAVLSGVWAEGTIALGEETQAREVLACTARLLSAQARPGTDSAEVEGTVAFTAVYRDANGALCSATGASTFTHTLRMEGVQSDMPVAVQGTMSDARATLESPGRIAVQAMAELECTARCLRQSRVLQQAQDAGLQLKQDTLYWFEPAGTWQDALTLRDEVQLERSQADIAAVLCAAGHARITQVEARKDALQVSGEATVEVLYADPTGQFHTLGLQLPFAQECQAQGCQAEMEALARGDLLQVYANVYPDAQGAARIVKVEAPLQLQGTLYSAMSTAAVVDAWHTACQVQLAKETVQLCDAPVQYALQHSLRLPVEEPGALAQCTGTPAALGEAALTRIDYDRGEMTLEGEIRLQAFFQGPEDTPTAQRLAVPFACTLAYEGAQAAHDLQVQVACENCRLQYSPAAAQWQLACQLQVQCVATAENTCTCVRELQKGEELPRAAGAMVLCIVQNGETLWDVARRCRITQEDLLQANPALQGAQLPQGMCIAALRR